MNKCNRKIRGDKSTGWLYKVPTADHSNRGINLLGTKLSFFHIPPFYLNLQWSQAIKLICFKQAAETHANYAV